MTYKHDTLIRQWLDGIVIQYYEDGIWRDMPMPSSADKMPHFYPDQQYRVRPTNVRVRLGLLHGGKVLVAQSLQEERDIGRLKLFREWLTDWQEYER